MFARKIYNTLRTQGYLRIKKKLIEWRIRKMTFAIARSKVSRAEWRNGMPLD